MTVNIVKVQPGWYEWTAYWGRFGFRGRSTTKHGAWCSIRARYHEFGLNGAQPIGEILRAAA